MRKFRDELIRLLPGYKWTVHKPSVFFEKTPELISDLTAEGTISKGFNRLSTIEIRRIEKNTGVEYTARSAGSGTRSRWLGEQKRDTLAQAIRSLQEYHEMWAREHAAHAGYIQGSRKKKVT